MNDKYAKELVAELRLIRKELAKIRILLEEGREVNKNVQYENRGVSALPPGV